MMMLMTMTMMMIMMMILMIQMLIMNTEFEKLGNAIDDINAHHEHGISETLKLD